MDASTLLKALDNEDNENILGVTFESIEKNKLEIINELELPVAIKKRHMLALKDYQFVEELDKFKYGMYIRWIPISQPDKLTKGGVICNFIVTDVGTNILCKNFLGNLFQMKVDDNIVFQKLSKQEKTILHAMSLLS